MMTNKTDYYYILQVSPQATAEDIKMSFRRLARQYHPDLNPDDPETAEYFKQISQAYDVLSDAVKRRRYDRDRRTSRTSSYQKTTYTSSSYSKPNSEVKKAQDFFSQGIAKSKNKEYRQAVEKYSKAIQLDPSFVDAYLKRCEMLYKLGDNQGVLDDCSRIIKINSSLPKAYYYQGRSRFSLGYVEAAIDSYSEAIRQDKNYAQAHYYRGIAYQDLKDYLLALEDWQTAAELFRNEGNYGAYRLTKKNINALNRRYFGIGSSFSEIANLFNNSVMTFATYIFNPVGGLLSAFNRLSDYQAMGIGLIYGISTDFCLTGNSYLLARTPNNLIPSTSDFSFPQLLFLNILPFLLLFVSSFIIRIFNNITRNVAQDIFLAGTSLLPLTIFLLGIGFFADSEGIATLPLLILPIFGFSYGILTLYTNFTQIMRLSEVKSTFLTPLIMSICLGLHYSIRYILSN